MLEPPQLLSQARQRSRGALVGDVFHKRQTIKNPATHMLQRVVQVLGLWYTHIDVNIADRLIDGAGFYPRW